MGSLDIINLANSLKQNFNSNNPFSLCEFLEIPIKFMTISPCCKAYTLRPYDKPYISINSRYEKKSQLVLCAHELGHALLHKSASNHFEDNNLVEEYEANLFAVALLFNQDDLGISISSMDNYLLKGLLDINIRLSQIS